MTRIGFGRDEWEHLVSQTFVPLAIRADSDGFRGSVEQRDLGDGVRLTDVTTEGPSRALRTSRLVRRAECDDVLFSLHVDGAGGVHQNGRDAVLAPGAGVLYRAGEPYDLTFPTATRQIVLQAPRTLIPLDQRGISASCAVCVPATAPAMRVLRSVVRDVFESSDTMGGALRADMSLHLLDLLATTVSHGALVLGPDSDLLREIQRDIRHRLSERGLTPAELARRHNVSVRQLYRMFGAAGTTPAGYIRDARLNRARQHLTRPHASVVAVAAAVGFDDVTTFARAFQRRFGLSPSRWRAGDTNRQGTPDGRAANAD